MGYSHWNDDFYNDKAATRAATNTPTFAYDAAVKSGAVATAVNDRLNIVGKIRESRDSVEHPNSVAIFVGLDVTGSMASVPRTVQAALPKLMGLLTRKGYVVDPQVLVAAIGDCNSDRVPVQVGQFESGVEMDDDITNLYLEGNGGGQNMESYQTMLYFAAHRTSIDCYEKRGKKGYLFLTGDEKPYVMSPRSELEKYLGQTAKDSLGRTHAIEGDANIKDIINAVTEKYEVFFIIPGGASHTGASWLKNTWSELLGPERVLTLDDPSAICELIGSTIGLMEGSASMDAIAKDLTDVGASTAIVKSVTGGLDTLARSAALMKSGTGGNLPEKTGRSADTERL
jgi:hypothetical protein